MSFIMGCPYCGQKLTVEEKWIGQKATCPTCKHNIIIQGEQQYLPMSEFNTDTKKFVSDQQEETRNLIKENSDNNCDGDSLAQKNCPFCGGIIKKQALICKHCKKNLVMLENTKTEKESFFVFICPECDYATELSESMKGKEYECPRCCESTVANEGKDRKCPLCGEMIKIKATFCKHCKKDIEPLHLNNNSSQTAAMQSSAINNKTNLQQKTMHNNSRVSNVYQAKSIQTLSLWDYFIQTSFCVPTSAILSHKQWKGRACRKEFWGVVLFWQIIIFVPTFIVLYLNLTGKNISEWCLLPLLFSYLLRSLPIECRRLHDFGFSATGWLIARLTVLGMTLLSWLPHISKDFDIAVTVLNYIIEIMTIVIGCIKGNAEKNSFGENPLHEEIRKKEINKENIMSFIGLIFVPIVIIIIVLC